MPFSRRAGWCRSQNTLFYRSEGRKTNRINRTYRISRSKSSVYRVSSNLDLFVKFWYCVSSLAFLVQNYTNLCNPASFVQRISFRKLSHFKGFLGKILSNSVSQKFLTKVENRGNIFYILVYWSSFLVLWTILELSIEFYMYFHKLSRPTPPHQVVDRKK